MLNLLEEIIKKEFSKSKIKGKINLHMSPYIPPEKDISSKTYIVPEEGLFVKEKERSHKKTLWEFYMLYVWNKLFKKIRKKCNHLPIEINIPFPSHLEIISKNVVRLYMEFIPGYPLKEYSKKSKAEIENTIIEIDNRELNLIEVIAYGLGIICKIKKDFDLFHGDMDFRHIMFNYEIKKEKKKSKKKPKITFTLIDLEKASFYKEIKDYVKKDIFRKAIENENYKCKGALIEKFSHLANIERINYFFDLGNKYYITSIKKIDHYMETVRTNFFKSYNIKDILDILKPHKACIEKIKQFALE